MSITETELKMNLDKYLSLSETEDVYITRNGKTIAKLVCAGSLTMDEINEEIAKARHGENSGIAALEIACHEAEANGTANLTLEEIDAEIAAVRRGMEAAE